MNDWRFNLLRLLSAVTLFASSLPGNVVAQPVDDALAQQNKLTVQRAFDAWAKGGSRFFDILADDVVWTVQGSGVNANTYKNKSEFLKNAVEPFGMRMSVPLKPTVRAIYADGDEVVTLFDGTAQRADGIPYRNTYAWFFTMRGGKVASARAFLDLPAYDAVLRDVEPAAHR